MLKPKPQITHLAYDKQVAAMAEWIRESVSPFDNDTKATQTARIAATEADFLLFCTTYLPHYFPVDWGAFHAEWFEISQEPGFRPIAAPREHGKSTFFSFAVPLYNLLVRKVKFQIIASYTETQAHRFLLPIRLELQENKRILHDFGPQVGPVWSEGELITHSGCNLLARSREQQIRGLKYLQHRPGYIVLDDIETDRTVASDKVTSATLAWIRRTVIPAAGQDCPVLMVGNKFASSSALAQLLAELDESGNLRYQGCEYTAWLDYGTPSQRPAWPAQWSVDRLEKLLRTIGTAAFLAEMQHITDHGKIIKPAWIKYYEPAEVDRRGLEVVIFCDPSATSGKSSDCKAVVTVGLDRKVMVFYVLHAWVRVATQGEMFSAIYAAHEAYQPRLIGIEDNAYKDFLIAAIQQEALNRGQYLPWLRHHTTGNKLARIVGGLGVILEYGNLLFCHNSDQATLVQQLLGIGGSGPDDGPDALAGAVAILQTKSGRKVGHVPLPARKRGERINNRRGRRN